MARDFMISVSAFGFQRLAFGSGETLAGLIFLIVFMYYLSQWHDKFRNRV